MSIHCLICSGTENWIDGKECVPDKRTWVVIRVFNDPYDNPAKRKIEEWWMHRYCLMNWIVERTEADTKLKDEVRWCD